MFQEVDKNENRLLFIKKGKEKNRCLHINTNFTLAVPRTQVIKVERNIS